MHPSLLTLGKLRDSHDHPVHVDSSVADLLTEIWRVSSLTELSDFGSTCMKSDTLTSIGLAYLCYTVIKLHDLQCEASRDITIIKFAQKLFSVVASRRLHQLPCLILHRTKYFLPRSYNGAPGDISVEDSWSSVGFSSRGLPVGIACCSLAVTRIWLFRLLTYIPCLKRRVLKLYKIYSKWWKVEVHFSLSLVILSLFHWEPICLMINTNLWYLFCYMINVYFHN